MADSKTHLQRHDGELEITEAEVDENLEETFPASDSPSWTLGCTRRQDHEIARPGAPRRG